MHNPARQCTWYMAIWYEAVQIHRYGWDDSRPYMEVRRFLPARMATVLCKLCGHKWSTWYDLTQTQPLVLATAYCTCGAIGATEVRNDVRVEVW